MIAYDAYQFPVAITAVGETVSQVVCSAVISEGWFPFISVQRCWCLAIPLGIDPELLCWAIQQFSDFTLYSSEISEDAHVGIVSHWEIIQEFSSAVWGRKQVTQTEQFSAKILLQLVI